MRNYTCMVPPLLLNNECYNCHYKRSCLFWDREDLSTRWRKSKEEMITVMREHKITDAAPFCNEQGEIDE